MGSGYSDHHLIETDNRKMGVIDIVIMAMLIYVGFLVHKEEAVLIIVKPIEGIIDLCLDICHTRFGIIVINIAQAVLLNAGQPVGLYKMRGAVSFSAEQKHTNIKTVKIRFCYQKNDSESGFYVEIFEINLSNFILYVFFSRDLALWRTPVRLREPNHDFCI